MKAIEKMCLIFLCAYVRDTTKTSIYQIDYKENPSEPILNILCVNKEDLEIYTKLRINFSSAYLRNANLHDSNLRLPNLYNVNLKGAHLAAADLFNAIVFDANLTDAHLFRADLTDVLLYNANLTGAYLVDANLLGADFEGAYLWQANLTDTNLEKANLKGAYSSIDVYVESFKERIKSRIGIETDLSGILGRYDPKNPPFIGKPIFGSYTEKDADEIIKMYRDSQSPKNIGN